MHSKHSRPRGRRVWPEVAVMFWRGYSMRQIARKTGLTHNGARYIVQQVMKHIDISPELLILSESEWYLTTRNSPKRAMVDGVPQEDFKQAHSPRLERMMQLVDRIAKRNWKKRSIAA